MGDVDGMVKIFTQTPLRKLLHRMKYSSTKERFASLDCFQNLFLHWMNVFQKGSGRCFPLNNLGLGHDVKVNCCSPLLIYRPIEFCFYMSSDTLSIVFLGEKLLSLPFPFPLLFC